MTAAPSASASSSDISAAVAAVGRHWGWLLFAAICSIGLGVALLVWPQRTVVVISVLLGAYLLVSGIFQIVASFTVEGVTGGIRTLGVISGALSLLLGLFAFRSIAHSVGILVLLIGFGWLFRGIAEAVGAIADRSMPGRGWQIFLGVLSALAGIVILVWPISSLTVLAVVGGIWLVVIGLFEVAGAFALRSIARSAS